MRLDTGGPYSTYPPKDPISFAAGDTNLYGYGLSDPVNQADPAGLGNVVAGVGGSLAAGPGMEGSLGVVANTRFASLSDFGFTGSGGLPFGVNVSGDAVP